jgi:hypothetical protein
MANGTGPIPVLPDAVWNAIKDEDLVSGKWDGKQLHLVIESGENSAEWVLADDQEPYLACPMSSSDWDLIQGGTKSGNVVSVGANEYRLHVERGASSTCAATVVRSL